MNLDLDVSTVTTWALLWIALLPLGGAVINGIGGTIFKGSRELVTLVGVGSVAGAFVLSVVCFLALVERGAGASLETEVYEWFRISVGSVDVPIRFAFVLDALSGVMALVVTGIGLLIHIYSVGYMHDDPGYARFFTYLNLFTGSMLLLVLGSSLPLMFVGWEGVGLCSYLLIGFWYDTPAYAAAGKKAFIVNRIGDFGVLAGMFLLVGVAHSFEFADLNRAAAEGAFDRGFQLMGEAPWSVPVATVAALFLFLGCTGKSAQIPLFVWLPDAMAGPTPVSALIHAATMVTAGVYLCCRLSSVFLASPTAMAVIAVVGALTALVAASIALVQNQMKKILAYSTVSQLGFMFAAVGAGAFAAGFFHVFTHAFFKACLFLGAGSVMHAVHAHGDADIRELGGLKRHMPATRMTFLLSCLAIAGIPGFSGFFSKDEILLGTLVSTAYLPVPWLGHVLFALLLAAATMTAFYMFRLYFLTFEGEYRGHAHPHESPGTITGPLWVLGVGAVLVGFLGMPHWLGAPNLWGHWLEHAIARPAIDGVEELEHHLGPVAMGLGTLVGLVGVGAAWVVYMKRAGAPTKRLAEAMPGLHRLLMDKWRVDELYEATVIRLTRGTASASAAIDTYLVDGLLAHVTAWATELLAWLLARLQSGYVHAYGVAMLAGFLGVAWWLASPHADVETKVEGNEVHYEAALGHGYEFSWDLDADGEAEQGFGADATTSHRYGPDDYVAYVLLVEGRGRDPVELPIDGRHGRVVDRGVLGGGWDADDEDHEEREPFVRVVKADGGRHEVVLRPNSARVRVRGRVALEEERLAVGDAFEVQAEERVLVRVLPVVRARLFVRSAFGTVSTAEVETVLEDVAAREPHAEAMIP